MNKGFIQYNQVTFSWFNLLNKQKDFTYTTYYSLPTPTSLTDLTRSTDILPTTKKSVYLVVNCIDTLLYPTSNECLFRTDLPFLFGLLFPAQCLRQPNKRVFCYSTGQRVFW